FYRLNVIPVTLPSLRERQGDIKLLVEHFMHKYLGEKAPKISPEVLAELQSYSWPGNIRELQNAVERAAILSQGRAPNKNDFLFSAEMKSVPLSERVEIIKEQTEIVELEDDLMIRSGLTVHEMEKKLIIETLRSTNSNRTQAAKLLGISIRTLRNKLNDYKKEGVEI
ncbi:MAG: sigma-54-dependent Fis family transcriptional regulator, partial [Bdellovibrionales bacterium]|nr:sigma-54-dependent Fis family transcriptional regulator [Bdellovibrionales bacterium]